MIQDEDNEWKTISFLGIRGLFWSRERTKSRALPDSLSEYCDDLGFAQMSGSKEEIKVSGIRNSSDVNLVFPEGFSFFEPYLQYYVKEILEIGGEAYVSRTPEGSISGIFIYDGYEKIGSVFTRSRKVFDYFYELKPFNFFFAEMVSNDRDSETFDIHTIDLKSTFIDHLFSHEISVLSDQHLDELEQQMISIHPRINRKWVKVALKNGERCFCVRLVDEIAGLGWVSMVNGVGRLHSLYVKPQFRRIGIGEDILFARLYWLKSKHASSAFSEISRYNFSSAKIAARGGMKVTGEIFQYFKRDPESKKVEPRI